MAQRLLHAPPTMGTNVREARGFTVIEIMIVLGIIGVLASVAIPLFHKNQMRTRFAELPTQVQAIQKAQEALSQMEGGSGGSGYYQFAQALPAGCDGLADGAQPRAWTAADIAEAGRIDWVVQGRTYGCYEARVTGGSVPRGKALTVVARSDIDGDGVPACVVLFQPQRGEGGSVVTMPPDGSCAPAGPPFAMVRVMNQDVY